MVALGHWLADITYHTLISYLVSRYGKVIIPKQKIVISVLALFIIGLGMYFIVSILTKHI